MIKRLASASRKKTRKASVTLRAKSKKSHHVATRKPSIPAGKEDESTLAAEHVFLMYDEAEAKHAKA